MNVKSKLVLILPILSARYLGKEREHISIYGCCSFVLKKILYPVMIRPKKLHVAVTATRAVP
jgi:hypothetical protein